jgi:two-component system, cell cycle response regulator DivK
VKSILLVEDSRFLRLTCQQALVKAGYNVLSAEDGEQAVKIARQHTPDLILLDMLLPKLSGPQVLDALKQDAATADIPVVVLSGLSQKNEDKLKKQGALAYVEKGRLDEQNYSDSLLDAVRGVLGELKPATHGTQQKN